MTGWFITSGYFRNESVEYTENAFRLAFQKYGVGFEAYKSNELQFYLDGGEVKLLQNYAKPDFAIFWDKDVVLAGALEKWGVKVFNNSRAIELCDDKVKTLNFLAECGINMPKTVFAPLVFGNREESDEKFLTGLMQILSFPVVVKEASGSFGWQVYLAKDKAELLSLRQKLVHQPHLYQQFIKESAGKDARIIVIGGKAVASIVRQNDKDFRANVELGAKVSYRKAEQSFFAMAEKVCKLLDLDYAGVDLLFGKDGPLLCEVNSNAYFKGFESCCGIKVAEIYLDFALSKL